MDMTYHKYLVEFLDQNFKAPMLAINSLKAVEGLVGKDAKVTLLNANMVKVHMLWAVEPPNGDGFIVRTSLMKGKK